jgi:hypothetical protein
MRRFIRSSTAMNLSYMIEKFVWAVEWIGIPTLASSDRARKVALEVSFHVTLHFKVPVEQCVRMTDSTFQGLGRLAAWRDRFDRGADDDSACSRGSATSHPQRRFKKKNSPSCSCILRGSFSKVILGPGNLNPMRAVPLVVAC